MDKILIIANWKSNFDLTETKYFLDNINLPENIDNKTIVICPPYSTIYLLRKEIEDRKLPIHIGAQNISPFPKGAYTGEIAADMIEDSVDYVILGHSERRKYFKETDQDIENKIDLAKLSGLEPILCVQSESTYVPKSVDIVAYEPIFAIGTGEPDSPENADSTARAIKEHKAKRVLYGGSINSENVNSFTSRENIDGVLVGSASLDPSEFSKIIINS